MISNKSNERSFQSFISEMSKQFGVEHVKQALDACPDKKWTVLKPVFEGTPEGHLVIELESVLKEFIVNFNKQAPSPLNQKVTAISSRRPAARPVAHLQPHPEGERKAQLDRLLAASGPATGSAPAARRPVKPTAPATAPATAAPSPKKEALYHVKLDDDDNGCNCMLMTALAIGAIAIPIVWKYYL